MIIKQTAEILNSHFKKNAIQIIGDSGSIFRCTKEHDGKPYQVIYVDCSNSWTAKDFTQKSLEGYIEKYLLKDYYSNSGPLQWNYYYTFVSPATQIKKAEVQKHVIESDELYSRKFVLEPEELNDWLTRIEDLSKPPAGNVDQDLAATWRTALTKSNLDFIAESTSIEEGIRTIIDKAERKQRRTAVAGNGASSSSSSSSAESINSIRSLHIKNFRGKQYSTPIDFGKVNLITGPNGSGKTSLLEAIEVLLCGKVYRNQAAIPTNCDIVAEIHGLKKPLQFKDNTLSIYKARGKSWYNSPIEKFSHLEVSFSKYNFYNTDAAYLLANAKKDEKTAVDAFLDITLGQEVNDMESKLKKYEERLKKEQRSNSNDLKETENKINEEKKLIDRLTANIINPQEFLTTLIREAKKEKWQYTESRPSVSLRKSLTTAQSHLQNIIANTNWAKITNRKTLEILLKQYETGSRDLKSAQTSIQKTEEAIEKHRTLSEDLQAIRELFDQLIPYYKYEADKQLPGIEDKIETLTKSVANLEALKKILAKIKPDDLDLFEKSKTIQELDTQLTAARKTTDKKLDQLKSQKSGLTSGLAQLDAVIKEIKEKGLEFLKLSTNPTECPLCHSEMGSAELLNRLERSKRTIKGSAQIDELNLLITNAKANGELIERQIKLLEELKSLFFLVYKSRIYSRQPRFVFNYVSRLLASLEDDKKSLKELKDSNDYFYLLGFEENDFHELIDTLKGYKIKIKDVDNLIELSNKNKKEQQDAAKKIRDMEADLKTSKAKKTESLSKLSLTNRQEEQVDKRLEMLLAAESLCEKLLQQKEYSGVETFNDIVNEAKTLYKLLDEYDNLEQKKSENASRLEQSSKNKITLEETRKDLVDKKERIDKSLKAIVGILTNNSKADYLKNFSNRNKKEIFEIFKMVHSPQEFTDLKFLESGDISLERNGKDSAGLNEISTGQRAALCLSVFSALNRKLKNGPNFMLFDDPVANIDDLNVLSYLDYLREVALKGNRQIFFATANEKLAFLFSKKFSFLGDEFKILQPGKEYQALPTS